MAGPMDSGAPTSQAGILLACINKLLEIGSVYEIGAFDDFAFAFIYIQLKLVIHKLLILTYT